MQKQLAQLMWRGLITVAMGLVLLRCPGVRPTQAETETPLAGDFTVTTASDSSPVGDTVLSLREALMVANGSLTGPFSVAERALLGGCQFNGGGTITGGCGAGISDSIQFTATLGVEPVITLQSALPAISDSASTIIYGYLNGVYPILNAANVGAGNDGLVVTSNDNQIYGLTLVSAPRDGLRVTGNNNVINQSSFRANGRYGIGVDGGDLNGFAINYVGVFSVSATCAGNADAGLAFFNGATNNTVSGNVVGCNLTGVSLKNSGTNNNLIGPNNVIGTNTALTATLANKVGVEISNGAQTNRVLTSTIYSNTFTGILISGSGSNFNSARANVIRNNGNGVEINNGAAQNEIGSPIGGPAAQGNTISANGLVTTSITTGNGVLISGVGTNGNTLYNNRIGVTANGLAADRNRRHGVRITDGAYGNQIGQQATERNIISGNGRNAVYLDNNAHDNYVQGNYLGTNLNGTAALANGWDGVNLDTGAYNNVIGAASAVNSAAYLNLIAGNFGYGISIYGSNTASNTIAHNDIGVNASVLLDQPRLAAEATLSNPNTIALGNGLAGIYLTDGAHHNVITNSNYLAYNGWLDAVNNGHGIMIEELFGANGAHDNIIYAATVYSSTNHGIWISGATSTGNRVFNSTTYANGRDGLAITSGATGWWRQLQAYANVGLGIDTAALNNTQNTISAPYPMITAVSRVGNSVTLTGTATASDGSTTVEVEVYYAATDPSGFGEGRYYRAVAITNNAGAWSTTFTEPNPVGCYAAYQTAYTLLATTSSEFGPVSAPCARLFAPFVRK